MKILTFHHTLLAADLNDARLKQVTTLSIPDTVIDITPNEISILELQPPKGELGNLITSGPLDGYVYVKNLSGDGTFSLFKDGYFLCANPDFDTIVCDRAVASIWESFRFVPHETALNAVSIWNQTEDAFATRVRALADNGRPVCLHFGCGYRFITRFLNVDKAPFSDTYSEDYFIFNFAESRWPIPDSCVDDIFSEDFIEHIPQINQIAFLAEAYRVLKIGCYHRVSTPCLYDSMKRHSDFTKGFSGVYFGERDKWGHISLFTRASIQETALMIGYRHVNFTAKSLGTSPHAVDDSRPGSDRDELTGNIFADLLK